MTASVLSIQRYTLTQFDIGLRNFASADSQCFEYFNKSSIESFIRAVDQLESYMFDEGPFDGIIAFSSGAAVAATLIARHFDEDNILKNSLSPIKCVVFFSALQGLSYNALLRGEVQRLKSPHEVIQLPTAHIWGQNDLDWSKDSEELSGTCAAEDRSVYIHRGVHEIPGPRMADSMMETVKIIRRTIDRAASGQRVS
jgi:hypothetical protein